MHLQTKKLTGKQISFLRGLGHHLSPIVMIGKAGITDNLIKSVNHVLDSHELIKVKVQGNCPLNNKEAATTLNQQTNSKVVQIIGKIFLLYRANKEIDHENKIKLPHK